MLCGQECLQINLLPIIDKWSSGICIYLPDLSPMHWMGCPALRWPLQESGMSTIHMHLKTLQHKGQDLHDRCSTPNRTVAEEPMWDRKKWESLMSGPIWVSNRFLLYLDFWFSINAETLTVQNSNTLTLLQSSSKDTTEELSQLITCIGTTAPQQESKQTILCYSDLLPLQETKKSWSLTVA